MNRAIRTYSLFLVLVLIATSCNEQKDNVKSVMSEAELLAAANRLDSSFLDAFNRGDINAFMELYWNNPELTAFPPAREMQLKGFEEVKEFYTKDFATNKGGRLEYISNQNIPFKDAVIGQGRFRWSMPMEGGVPIVFEGRHTVVKAIRDGKMVIVTDHTSAPLMPIVPATDR